MFSRTHVYSGVSLFVFLASGGCVAWGVALILNAVAQNGSPPGSILVGALGLIFLLISPIGFALGMVARRSAQSSLVDHCAFSSKSRTPCQTSDGCADTAFVSGHAGPN